MPRRVPPRGGGVLFVGALLLALGAPATAGRAAEIAWERTNPFQGCLAASLDKWLDAQVDLLTNEDPATWRTDDRSVAMWTVGALAACKAKAGGGDDATETTFTKYMAQWRRHIYELVDAVRQKGKPD